LGIKALAIRHPNSASSSWVTASFGVASILPTSKAKSSDLIDEADQALYFAKQNGRDRIAYFQPPTFVTQSII
ncbi:MAG: GGDEF domain-containing protein, partial [Cyanobacteria bacterium P01_F01_bin.116]